MRILYYRPSGYSPRGVDVRWLYGLDIIEELERRHSPVWIFSKVDGSSAKQNMLYRYRFSDVLLRPTRHDGLSCMVQEALHFGCPVIHTYPVPGVIHVKADVDEIEKELKKIDENRRKHKASRSASAVVH